VVLTKKEQRTLADESLLSLALRFSALPTYCSSLISIGEEQADFGCSSREMLGDWERSSSPFAIRRNVPSTSTGLHDHLAKPGLLMMQPEWALLGERANWTPQTELFQGLPVSPL